MSERTMGDGCFAGFMITYFIVGYVLFNFTTSLINRLFWVNVGIAGCILALLFCRMKDNEVEGWRRSYNRALIRRLHSTNRRGR